MAPDALDAEFGEQPFHFILKFLAYEVIFQNRDDQDFLELWQGLVRKNPTVHNFRTGKQRRRNRRQGSQYKKEEMYSDTARD